MAFVLYAAWKKLLLTFMFVISVHLILNSHFFHLFFGQPLHDYIKMFLLNRNSIIMHRHAYIYGFVILNTISRKMFTLQEIMVNWAMEIAPLRNSLNWWEEHYLGRWWSLFMLVTDTVLRSLRRVNCTHGARGTMDD